MASSFDSYLAIAAIYIVIACLYLKPHSRISRILLALAALMLAACAAANSDYVRAWELQPHHHTPTYIEAGADFPWMPGTSPGMTIDEDKRRLEEPSPREIV